MTEPVNRPLAYLKLMRFANVFTAVADPLAGWIIIGGGSPRWHLGLLMAASAALYTSGMVLNDCFDYELDKVERPERPLPRGDIARGTAWALGAALMIAGLACAAVAGPVALGIASFIAFMIFFYNAWAKRFVGLGPAVLGACRFANFLLGMRCSPPRLWMAPAFLAIYVTILTVIARNEAVKPSLRLVVKRLLLGIIVVDATAVFIITGDWAYTALVLFLLIPAILMGKMLPMT